MTTFPVHRPKPSGETIWQTPSTREFIYEQSKWPTREENFSKPWLHHYNGIQCQYFKETTKISLCGDRHYVHNVQSRGKLFIIDYGTARINEMGFDTVKGHE